MSSSPANYFAADLMTSLKIEDSNDLPNKMPIISKNEPSEILQNVDEKIMLRNAKSDDDCGITVARQNSHQTNRLEKLSIAAWDLRGEVSQIASEDLVKKCYATPHAIWHSSRFVAQNFDQILANLKIDKNTTNRITSIEPDHVITVDKSALSAVVLRFLESYVKNTVEDAEKSISLETQEFAYIFPFSYYACRNGRRKMEDSHVIVPNLKLLHADTDKSLKSGTTAVCAFIFDQTMFLAWLGDSQVLLMDHSKKWTFFSRKHDTKDEAECNKISEKGGIVLNILGTNRVNGVVNITRSLGDQFLKPPLSAEPEVKIFQLTGNENFLVLGSDGLWDGLSADDCAEIIAEYCRDHECNTYENLARHLVEKSQSNGVTDNITAIVLFMQPFEQLKAAYQ